MACDSIIKRTVSKWTSRRFNLQLVLSKPLWRLLLRILLRVHLSSMLM